METLDLPPIKAKILTILIKNNRWMNTTEVAKLSEVSWNTAIKYLEDMEEDEWISRSRNSKNHWRARIK